MDVTVYVQLQQPEMLLYVQELVTYSFLPHVCIFDYRVFALLLETKQRWER